MTPRILLMGKKGQVGSELVPLLEPLSELTAVGRDEVDLAKPDEIRRVIAHSRPHLIVNAAAYTAVDQAEKEEPLARAINAAAPAVMAEEAKKRGALVIHYSTDYVFDGAKRSPYVETDPTNPLNAYGRTKLAGEEAIGASGAAHLILRTAWVYATSGKNFLLTILRLATTREELRIVNDQFGAPTSARAIAQATAQILRGCGAGVSPAIWRPEGGSAGLQPREKSVDENGALALDPGRVQNPDALALLANGAGTYHLTAAGQTTWYEFAVAIVNECSRIGHGAPPSAAPEWFAAATAGRPLITTRIVPITTEDYPLPARRPAYSVLSNARFATTFGFALPEWRSQLARTCGLRHNKT
jgi:dTDP-4-dehydrorhamnose reductase